jgi:hypothetical protein
MLAKGIPSVLEETLVHIFNLFWLLSMLMPPISASIYQRKHWRRPTAVIIPVIFEIFPLAMIAINLAYVRMDYAWNYEEIYIWTLPAKALGWFVSLKIIMKPEQPSTSQHPPHPQST